MRGRAPARVEPKTDATELLSQCRLKTASAPPKSRPVVTRHGATTALTTKAIKTAAHVSRKMRRPVACGSSPSPSGPRVRALSTLSLITERKILHGGASACRVGTLAPGSLVKLRDDAYEFVEADDRAEDDAGDHYPTRSEPMV